MGVITIDPPYQQAPQLYPRGGVGSWPGAKPGKRRCAIRQRGLTGRIGQVEAVPREVPAQHAL